MSWQHGVEQALRLLSEAEGQSDVMGLDPQYRTGPQGNVVLEYLQGLEGRVLEGFTATLSDYISACQNEGVPNIETLAEDAMQAAIAD